MNDKKNKKLNIKSNYGFTMIDLVIALIIIMIFSGIIGTALYEAFKMNSKTKVSAAALNFVIEILEDIDKITYDEVQNGMESKYMTQFSIPSGYNLSINVSNYIEGNETEDLIKIVKLTIEYKMAGNEEKIVIEKIKVREM